MSRSSTVGWNMGTQSAACLIKGQHSGTQHGKPNVLTKGSRDDRRQCQRGVANLFGGRRGRAATDWAGAAEADRTRWQHVQLEDAGLRCDEGDEADVVDLVVILLVVVTGPLDTLRMLLILRLDMERQGVHRGKGRCNSGTARNSHESPQ